MFSVLCATLKIFWNLLVVVLYLYNTTVHTVLGQYTHGPQHANGGQRTILWSWFSLYTFVWVLGIVCQVLFFFFAHWAILLTTIFAFMIAITSQSPSSDHMFSKQWLMFLQIYVSCCVCWNIREAGTPASPRHYCTSSWHSLCGPMKEKELCGSEPGVTS